MNINLRHWVGTILVAVAAGFVIFVLLRGQGILNDFLKSEPTDANLERGELLVLIPSLALSQSPKPSPSPKLKPKLTLKSSPSLTPAPSPSPLPTPPQSGANGTLSVSSKPTPTPTPVSTPIPTLTPTFSPIPTPSLIPTPSPTPLETPLPTPTPSPTASSTPSVNAVVINEIAWMGTAADPTDEWIELYNPNSFVVDINGWTIKAFKIKNGVLTADTPDITFLEKTIGAFGYLLFERTSDNTISDISADFIYTGALDNPGEILELRDNAGQLKDTVGHKDESGQVVIWYNGHNPSKSTMERIDPLKPGDISSNWQTNNGITKNGLDAKGNPINGTPKAKNSSQVY